MQKADVPAIKFGSRGGEGFIEWPGFERIFETRETGAGLTIGTYYNAEQGLTGFIEGELSPSSEDMEAELPPVIMAEIPRYTNEQLKRVVLAASDPEKHREEVEAFALDDDVWPRSIDTIMFLRNRLGIKLHPLELVMCPNMTLQARLLEGSGLQYIADWQHAHLVDQHAERKLYLYEIDVLKLAPEALAEVPAYIRAFAEDIRNTTGWQRPDPVRLVSVTCPSTGTVYLLRVPPPADGGDDDVLSMVAWTFGLTKDEYILDAEG